MTEAAPYSITTMRNSVECVPVRGRHSRHIGKPVAGVRPFMKLGLKWTDDRQTEQNVLEERSWLAHIF